MKTRRPKSRKTEILDAALTLARNIGYQAITREALANQARCSEATISLYFGTMPQLRRAIMSAAVARDDLIVIAQGLAVGDAKARAAAVGQRRAAAEGMI